MSLTINLIQKETWVHIGRNELDREKAILLRRLRDIESIKSDSFLEELGGPAWERRKSRRQAERRNGDVIIPNGPWNNDLDEYHGTQEYPVNLPSELHSKGYRAYACRNFHTWTWNGYVSMPTVHPFFGEVTHTDFFYDCYSKGITAPPQEITFIQNGTFGWDHARSEECCPIPRNSTEPRTIGYINFAGISQECVEFATWLASHEHIKIAKASCDCGKCAGCLWDHSNDCSGEIDCTCRICSPCDRRVRVEPGKTRCRCDPQSCNCYGCFECVAKCAKISQEVNTMMDAIRTSSFWTQYTPVAPVAPVAPVDLSNISEDNDGPWITVRSKRRYKHL
jgi:hypothetical protein